MKIDPDWAGFERFVAEIMERERIAGASVGVSRRGQVLYARGFGVGSLETGRAVDEETVFGIASISKSFAALAVMQLADEGLVDPMAPVAEYLPGFSLRGVEDIAEVKVHHCLSHTTGIPPLKRRQGEFAGFDQHLEYLAGYDTPMLGRPGEHLSYCNDAFLLSGAIVEKVSGRRFRDHVRDRVFAPLGMKRTTYEIDELLGWDNVTELYNLDSGKTSLQIQPWPQLGTYHVGGGVRSTVLDLLRYGDMFCSYGRAADGGRVVSEAGVLRMRAPVHPAVSGGFYCYALQLTPAYHGVTLVEHGGALPGVSSRWGYIPEQALSAVVLTNVRGVPAELIWTGLVNTMLGLPPSAPRAEAQATYPAEAEQLGRLVGLYVTDEGARVNVSLATGGPLELEADGVCHQLRMTAPDRAVYLAQGEEKTIRFHLRKDGGDGGQAWAISTGLRMVMRSAVGGHLDGK